jgi:hypothetical protein
MRRGREWLDLDLRGHLDTSENGAGEAKMASRVPRRTHIHLNISPLWERNEWACGLGGGGPNTTWSKDTRGLVGKGGHWD